MNRLSQIKQANACFYEMEVEDKCLKGFQRLKAFCSFWIGEFLLLIILTVSIFIGDTKIPTYLGDGYSFDKGQKTICLKYIYKIIRLNSVLKIKNS